MQGPREGADRVVGALPGRLGMIVRRCPTLPHPPGCSTIGAVGLSFRVRNGTGRFPHAITTVTLAHTPTRGWQSLGSPVCGDTTSFCYRVVPGPGGFGVVTGWCCCNRIVDAHQQIRCVVSWTHALLLCARYLCGDSCQTFCCLTIHTPNQQVVWGVGKSSVY